MKQTTIEERLIIIKNFNDGKSYHEIMKIINRSLVLSSISKRYQNEDKIINKLRKTSNKKLNAYYERWIKRKVKKIPRLMSLNLLTKLKYI